MVPYVVDTVVVVTVMHVCMLRDCCCSPSETYGRKFSDPYRTASSTTGGWSCWNILMCLIYIYILLSTTVSHFWTLRMPYFFYETVRVRG